ncbi:MAG: glycosyltransferase family 9 protein [Ignavibacteria bacterium]
MSFGIRRFLLLLFSFIKYLYYSLINPFIKSSASKAGSKTLLIIKLDEIGDYILFRNFLKYFKFSEEFKDYMITLCGNIAWKELFDFLDKDYVDFSFWVKKKSFARNLFYRRKILNSAAGYPYHTVLNCSQSRNFFIDDAFIKTVYAENKYGCTTDLSSQFKWQKKLSDNYYSKLINVNEKHIFDFHRNREFISSILKAEIPEFLPKIEKSNLVSERIVNEKYAAFYLAGRKNYKIWRINSFLKAARYLKEKYNLKIVLIGSSEDKKLSAEFENNFDKEAVINYTAKTSLVEIIEILNYASIMISNDSGLPHIAAALNTKLIVLVNGTHFGRFFPYPDDAQNVKAIYPPEIQNNLQDFEKLRKSFKYRSKLDINSISAEKVIFEAEEMLNK